MTVQAYRAAVSRAATPRDTEARLIREITGEMMEAERNGLKGAMLMAPLHRNREMWRVFATDCASPGNGLPDALRAAIISLSLWVERYTSDVMAGREPVGELIAVNRQIMEGLTTERLAA